MIPNPSLIPRFNIDYDTKDFVLSLLNCSKKPDISIISKTFPEQYIIFTNSGRTSLYIILKSLNLAKGAKIGVPIFSCTSVFDSIIQAGYKPVFLDCAANSLTLDFLQLKQKIDGLDALVVIHIYGIPVDMDRVLDIAGNRPVIEDCAHGLLSKYKGKLLGTFGDAAFFTFRTGKYISAGEGSIIITGNKLLASAMQAEILKLPTPSLKNELKHIIITYVRSTLYHRPWFGLISLPFGTYLERKMDIMNKYTFNKEQIRNSDLYVIVRKLASFQEKVEKQRSNSILLIDLLKKCNLKLPIEPSEQYFNYFLFPIVFSTEVECDTSSVALRKSGYDTMKLFSRTPSIAQQSYGYEGDCKNAEDILSRTLVVPNYYTLSTDRIRNLATFVREELRGC